LTRRFDIGPAVLTVGALALLVSLFLDWYAQLNAWQAFEFNDVLLAALAVAAIAEAVGLIAPGTEYLDRRALPWIVGAAFVLVATQLINPPPGSGGMTLGLGAWVAFVATIVMGAGALLSLSRVSFAVNVEHRDRRRRVAAVDHRPPPTETGAPVSRSSESLLHPRPESEEAQET
jgi:hypothetical protein